MNTLAFVVLLLAPVFSLLSHAIFARWGLRQFNRQLTAVLCCLMGALISTTLGFALLENAEPSFSTAILIFSLPLLLTHIYFHIFNMSETARRIKILISSHLNEKTASQADYLPDNLVAIRIERLLQAGQIEKRDGRIYGKKNILMAVAVVMEWYRFKLFPETN